MEASNYKIIMDPDALRDFIDWLPDLTDEEKFYCCLFSRKKYVPEDKKADHPWIKADDDQMKRFLVKKEFLFNRILQCEVPVGAFCYKNGKPAIQECLGMYMNYNPRNVYKAALPSIKKLLTLLEGKAEKADCQSEVMSICQTTVGAKATIMFDIDDKNIPVKNLIEISSGMCDIIQTRGGYHVHVRAGLVDVIPNKRWYLDYAALSDIKGDAMSPVVGCYQGGFTPKFVYRHDKNT